MRSAHPSLRAVGQSRAAAEDDIADALARLCEAIGDRIAERLSTDDGSSLTVAEAAERLRVSRDTVNEMVNRGELPAFLAGSRKRIAVADLVAYQRGRRVAPVRRRR